MAEVRDARADGLRHPLGDRLAGDPRTERLVAELRNAGSAAEVALRLQAALRMVSLVSPEVTVDFYGFGLETARDHAEALVRAASAFPVVRIQAVGSAALGLAGRLVYAQTDYSLRSIRVPGLGRLRFPDLRHGGTVSFNTFASSARYRMQQRGAVDQDARAGWLHPGWADPRAIAVHEFGHLMLYSAGRAARHAIVRVLARHALAHTVPRQPERQHPASGLSVAPGDVEQPHRASARPDWRPGSVADVMIRGEISQYAAENVDELAAEAFGDVVLNGRSASALSREIVEILAGHAAAARRRLTHLGDLPGAGRDRPVRREDPARAWPDT